MARKRRPPHLVILVPVALLAAAAGRPGLAFSDFQDATLQGWTQGPNAGPTIAVVADAGPDGAGDFALRVDPSMQAGNLFPHNLTNASFLGDYVRDGIVAVEFDAMAPASNAEQLRLHAVVLNGPFNRWVSLQSAVLPNDGVWRSYVLSIQEVDVVHPLGSNPFATDFSNVTQLGLRHQLLANQAGGSTLAGAARVFADNIELLPEPAPGLAAPAAAAALALLARGRARRRGRCAPAGEAAPDAA